MTIDALIKLHPSMTCLCAPASCSRLIKYIDIVEIPEGSAWTSPGDFIITTGYFLQSAAAFEQLVTRLIENEVVGLGVKMGKYVHEIPHTVRELAEANRFPILSIPMELSYRDVQKFFLHARENGSAPSSGRKDIVEFYNDVLLGSEHSPSGLKLLSERVDVDFRADRLIFTAAMEPESAKEAIDQLLMRPSPDLFLLYDDVYQQLIGVLTLRSGVSAEQGCLYGQQLFSSYCTTDAVLGVSEISASAATLRSAYDHARFALDIGRACAPRKPLYRYIDFIEHAFIYENRNSATLRQIVDEYLHPVLNYDEKKSADLLNTLYVADECSYNMQQACAVLGIHRNTLYDRIRKIGKLLHRDLNAKYVRDAIHLALICQKLTCLE